MIKDGDIVGNVTSCEISPTLNQIIGWPMRTPMMQPGRSHCDPHRGRRARQARVEALPFYDPDNARQAL